MEGRSGEEGIERNAEIAYSEISAIWGKAFGLLNSLSVLHSFRNDADTTQTSVYTTCERYAQLWLWKTSGQSLKNSLGNVVGIKSHQYDERDISDFKYLSVNHLIPDDYITDCITKILVFIEAFGNF